MNRPEGGHQGIHLAWAEEKRRRGRSRSVVYVQRNSKKKTAFKNGAWSIKLDTPYQANRKNRGILKEKAEGKRSADWKHLKVGE